MSELEKCGFRWGGYPYCHCYLQNGHIGNHLCRCEETSVNPAIATRPDSQPQQDAPIPERVVELSKLYLDMALNEQFPEEVRKASSDTVFALGELEQLRQWKATVNQHLVVAREERDEAKAALAQAREALNGDSSLGIEISNLRAIAWHLRAGHDNGKVPREGLAEFLEKLHAKLFTARAALAASEPGLASQ